MALEDDKFNRKDYMRGAHYTPAILTDVSISNGTTTHIVPHDAETVVFANSALAIHNSSTTSIRFRSYILTYAEAYAVVFTINKINYEIQNYLWDKFAEIDACTTTEQVNAVVWSYDITQVYDIDTTGAHNDVVEWANVFNRPYIPGESQVRAWAGEMFEEKGL